MALCLYGTNEPGYTPLDFDALTNEQAVEIAAMVHRVALDYSELRQLAPLSTAVLRVLSWCKPKIETLRDLRLKPLESWRSEPSMTFHVYNELREAVRPFGVRLPAWEMLP